MAYKVTILKSGASVFVHGVGFIRPHAPTLVDSMYIDNVIRSLRGKGYNNDDYVLEKVDTKDEVTRVGLTPGNKISLANFISKDLIL